MNMIAQAPSGRPCGRLAYRIQETAQMLGVCDKSGRRLILRGLRHPRRHSDSQNSCAARPPATARCRPAVRFRKAVPVPIEPAVPGSAAAAGEWLGEIRRSNVAEDRFRLLLWIASWGVLLLAFVW
jgi:hypothetical protein